MSRSAPALVLVALVATAGCSDDAAERCPGNIVGTLVLAGDRGPILAELDPDPATAECPADPAAAGYLGHPAALAPFTVTLASDPVTGGAVLCRGELAEPLFGTLTAGRLEVSVTTDGAVLVPACSARAQLTIAGDVTTGPDDALAFTGGLVERLEATTPEACGAYALPCAARYAVSSGPATVAQGARGR